MSFEALKLTNKGREMLLRSLEGEALVFTSIHIGDGEISGAGAIPALESLVSSIKAIDITRAQRSAENMTIEGYFKNDEIPRSFYWKELGVFVADPDNPDDRSADILFVYQNAYDTAEHISISTAEIIEKTVRVNVFVGEAENISAVIDSSVVFVTKAEFDGHTHIVADIDDFPDSMPANGGNADTVGGFTLGGNVSAEDIAKLQNTNIAYGTCATAAGTAAKVVTITGNTNWKIAVGSEIVVKFANTNTASSCTLNVNGTGAKQIWYNSAVYTENANTVCGCSNRYVKYMYDGTYWVWMGCSVDTTMVAASASSSGYVSTGAQVFAGNKAFTGQVFPNGASALGTAQARKIYAGTEDLEAGVSTLETGVIYLVYE